MVAIVEGHGEVKALPALIRRIAREVGEAEVAVSSPIRGKRNKLLKEGELERLVELAARQTSDGGILILLDADDDCPKQLAGALLQRARSARSDREIRVVIAKHEFEAWFLAGAESLAGICGLPETLEAPEDPEALRDAKGWLRKKMPPERCYSETVDQKELVGHLDLDLARRRSPSFAKLCRDLGALLGRDEGASPRA
ncbi:MAG: DUF4276 family protein [Planctomycetes bacterium]|nr:DUF4276 family protein [Planctomycetota bacterium]